MFRQVSDVCQERSKRIGVQHVFNAGTPPSWKCPCLLGYRCKKGNKKLACKNIILVVLLSSWFRSFLLFGCACCWFNAKLKTTNLHQNVIKICWTSVFTSALSSKNFGENNLVGSSQTLMDEMGIGVQRPLEWTMSLPLNFFVILLITWCFTWKLIDKGFNEEPSKCGSKEGFEKGSFWVSVSTPFKGVPLFMISRDRKAVCFDSSFFLLFPFSWWLSYPKFLISFATLYELIETIILID